MDPQTILNLLLGSASGVLGWFARELWSAVKALQADLSKLREELPKDYIAKTDFRDALKEVKDMLNRIFERLDDKADK